MIRRSERIAKMNMTTNDYSSENVPATYKSRPMADNKIIGKENKPEAVATEKCSKSASSGKQQRTKSGRNLNSAKNHQKERNIVDVPEEVKVKKNPRARGKDILKDIPVQSQKHSDSTSSNLEGSLKSMSITTITSTYHDHVSKNGSNIEMVATPVTAFMTRECIQTPEGKNIKKRLSLTPKNFLSKSEDPILQRIMSPKPKTPVNQHVPKSAMYFHEIVEKEDAKFTECCSRWNNILKEGGVPEEANGHVLAAIGQALLFQNKRFKQFKELIELHKDKSAEKAAYESDLHGFWEMIFFQVEDVHKRFAELEVLRSNNWQEQEKNIQPKKLKPKKLVKTVSKVEAPYKKPVVSSSKFKMFKQQMKAKKLSEQQTSDVIIF